MIFKKVSALERKTRYDKIKETKKENFNFLNKEVCEAGQIVLVGDSITEIFNTTDLFADFSKRTKLAVYNRGISGDTSNRLLERIRENVTAIKPRLISLLIGTNDLGVGFEIPMIVDNIGSIINQIKADCPETKIILQAVYPVNERVNKMMVGKRKNSDIKKLNELLKDLSEEKKILFLDLTDKLSDAEGRFNKDYTYDGLHPNAVGFRAVFEKLLPEIEKEL